MNIVGYNDIILDCDGVIFDSNTLKTRAFEYTLKEEGYSADIISGFLNYHQTNGGISRYVKFKELFSRFLYIDCDETIYQRLLKNYGGYCKQLYKEAAFTEHLQSFLERMTAKGIRLYIASGSDETELKEVLLDRGIIKYFSKVYGSPKAKDTCVGLVVKENIAGKSLMIGDAESDYNAAMNNNIDFIGISGYSENPHFFLKLGGKESVKIIETLGELL